MPFVSASASPIPATPEHLVDEHGWEFRVVAVALLVDFLQDGAQQLHISIGSVLEVPDEWEPLAR
jgi:hypothetical protein